MRRVDSESSATTLGRLRLAGAASLVLAAAVIVSAVPAQAHDGLTGSEPSSGARLERAPDSATLRFSAELNRLGSVVQVTNTDGEPVESKGTVAGSALEVDFGEQLPNGGYTIAWRVVSSDGHPIEGTTVNGQALRFTVEAAAASPVPVSPAAFATPSASVSPASPAPPSPTASPAATEPAADRQGGDAGTAPVPL